MVRTSEMVGKAVAVGSLISCVEASDWVDVIDEKILSLPVDVANIFVSHAIRVNKAYTAAINENLRFICSSNKINKKTGNFPIT
jgi:hypothetical protein